MLLSGWNYVMRMLSVFFRSMVLQSPKQHEETLETPVLKLLYFDVKGLAQAVRDTLTYAGIPFEDKRLTKDAFADQKQTLPFGQLPVLHVDDDVVAQSKAILRYASRRACTYPTNALNAALIDQFVELHTEFMNPLVMNMYPERVGLFQFDKAQHRKWCVEKHIPKYLAYLQKALTSTNEDEDTLWLAQMDNVSMADFCWYPTLCWLHDGTFDGVDATTFESYPNVLRFISDMKDQLD